MVVATAALEVGFGRGFFRSVSGLDGNSARQVNKAVEQFCEDPDHPSLNFHPVHSEGAGRLHTFRASQEVRVLLAREGSVYVLLEAGHHDDIYRRAETLRFVANRASRFVGLVDLSGETLPQREQHAAAGTAPEDGAGIFDHWGAADLREAGFDDGEIDVIRRCKSEDELAASDLDEETLLRAIDLVELTPEQWRSPGLDPAAEAEDRVRRAITEFGGLSGISPLFSPEEVAAIAAAPIEDWMIFLHPDQRAVVQRRFEGPARVRGSAGTGKTVVALHRAVELSQRFAGEENQSQPRSRILFTTFISTLPPVFEHLHARLPGADPTAIDFVNIDKLASRICREAGDQLVSNPAAVDAGFATAWQRVVQPTTAIAEAHLSRRYIRDEIEKVIKGRGLRSEDEYLGIERTGRRTRFGEVLRRQVWALMAEWDAQMQSRDTVDFADVILRARDHARRRNQSTYRAAIVDEAQDLTLVGLQLIRALVNGPSAIDRADGMFIVGDGAQRIYPGGFTLRQAGVEVRGRTTVLKTNYRNTREIIASAMAVAGREAVDDLGDEYHRGEAEAQGQRAGIRPVLVSAAGLSDEVCFIAERVNELSSSGAIGRGDIAVCASTNKVVDALREALEAAGIPCQPLTNYVGAPTDRLKVGTFHRAKGLEFKVVFLAGLGAEQFPRRQAPGQDLTEYDEQRVLEISQLFVAMTRARDGLFLLCSGGPGDVFGPGLDSFELLDT